MHFIATQYEKKILQRPKCAQNRTQEHKNQTANSTKYLILRGDLSVTEIQQNFLHWRSFWIYSDKRPKCALIVHRSKDIVNSFNKGREIKDNPVKLANFIFMEWNLCISSPLPLHQFVMSAYSKHFRLSLNVWDIIDTELYHI